MIFRLSHVRPFNKLYPVISIILTVGVSFMKPPGSTRLAASPLTARNQTIVQQRIPLKNYTKNLFQKSKKNKISHLYELAKLTPVTVITNRSPKRKRRDLSPKY